MQIKIKKTHTQRVQQTKKRNVPLAKKNVISDSACPMGIPPKVRSHFRANDNIFSKRQ